jgi:hypothetical protein
MKYLVFVLFLTSTQSLLAQVNWQTNPNDLKQYGYVPQMNNGTMYQALQYKQQLYDQRHEVVIKHHKYCLALFEEIINEKDRSYYIQEYDKNIRLINKMDLTTSDYYSIMDWYLQYEKLLEAVIDNQ